MADHSDHVIRVLKRNLKIANKIMGRQGETIHRLRAELAEVRSLNSKIERGDLRRYERNESILLEAVAKQLKLLAVQQERIKELENPEVADATEEYVNQ